MEFVLIFGCLLSELGHEHLVAIAQDMALSLSSDGIEIDEQGEVFVHATLSYRKQNAGFLASFCPDDVVIPKCWLPWAGNNLSRVQLSGIPSRFRMKQVLLPSLLYGVDISGNDLTVTLSDSDKIAGRIWISQFFNEKFRSLIEKPELRLVMTASTSYQMQPKSNLPDWAQDRFGPWMYGGLSREHAFRTLTFNNLPARTKKIEPSKKP